MSGRLNPVTYSTELVYVLRSSDQVYHLSRNPSNGFWNEAPLVVQTTGKTPEAIKYAAFITIITLSNEQGFPVPQGYPVNVFSKDPTIALINNQTYRLGKKAEVFLTDGSGCVSIIIPASNDAISCSELGVWLQSPMNPIQVSEVFSIEPAQRVVNTLRQVTSGSDILNAKRSDGKPVISNKAAVDTDVLNTAADLISKLPQFKSQGQSGSTKNQLSFSGMQARNC